MTDSHVRAEPTHSPRAAGVATRLWDAARANLAWWLTPIVVVSLVLGALLVLLSDDETTFVYTLF